MHAKHKGSLAELLACAWLLKQGYEVFRNVSQHGVADLIAWRENGLPMFIEVRSANIRLVHDDKSCSVATARLSRHPDVRFFYVFPETGDCGFDLEQIVMSRGYTLRRPRSAPQLVCSVENCGGKHFGRGFCKAHYTSWSRKLPDGLSLIPRPKIA